MDCSTIPVFQVPNEGGVSILDVNDEENVVLDEMRKKKKKKKQVSAPRPACSWVYFSREFIKEYSASHPESSGLKAATKAASDAWKLMSTEEKEKYTQRAREVWDNYLSTAPARIPKPRKQTKLVTRCSPGRLFNVLQRLTSEQKAAVKSMGFGSLLGLRCRTLRRSLCLWLLERFNTARRSLELCGERIPLSPRDVEHVMGLAACGKDVCGCLKNGWLLQKQETILRDHLSFMHWYNWGKFLLDRLVREVSRFRQGKQRAVGGCLLFLQLFYYESISIEGAGSSAPIDVPCLSSWGEEEISEREKRERELGGYGCGEVISKEGYHDMESLEYRIQVEGLSGVKMSTRVPVFEQEGTQVDEEQMNGDFSMEEICVVNFPRSKGVVCGDMEIIVEPDRRPCRNKEYGCSETVDYRRKNDHEDNCTFAPCACPLPKCNFVGSSEQLSLHFSNKHWDSGRRFGYNVPLSVSLEMNDQFLVLQAEEDGILFVLNKSVESIGNVVMVTCIAPSSSKLHFLYDLVCGKGISSLRLKSLTENFPGRVEGFPPMDFLLIPSRFLGPSGEISLEVCIWNSTELGSDCP
ncbi:hypothetical protein V6N13_078942 [Hibiscus sabdariffa]|uniref:RING-type E3 ubiquitin transferase n=1 Tax=Hibiscus sabdariffa TaxID=183260 RepID=A0ABR2RQC9_9ROSI